MRLEPLEYIVNKHMGEETITITKKALEKWRDHYNKVSDGIKIDSPHAHWQQFYYVGKVDVLTELLGYFDEEE